MFNTPKQKFTAAAHSKAFVDVHELEDVLPPSTVHEDNSACLKFARMPKLSPRTKHIGIPYHWFRTKVVNLKIDIQPIGTENQLADQFTKGLALDKFVPACWSLMGW